MCRDGVEAGGRGEEAGRTWLRQARETGWVRGGVGSKGRERGSEWRYKEESRTNSNDAKVNPLSLGLSPGTHQPSLPYLCSFPHFCTALSSFPRSLAVSTLALDRSNELCRATQEGCTPSPATPSPSRTHLSFLPHQEAASSKVSLPSKPVKYEPSRPQYGIAPSFLTPEQRREQSAVLASSSSSNVSGPRAPPPPRRTMSNNGQSDSAPPPARAPPPPAARKTAVLSRNPSVAAPAPPLPTRKPSFPAPPYTPPLPTRSPSIHEAAHHPPPAPPPRAAAPPPPPPAVRGGVPLDELLNSRLSLQRWKDNNGVEEDDKGEEAGQQPSRKPFSQYDERDKQDFFSALDTVCSSFSLDIRTPFELDSPLSQFFNSRLPGNASSAAAAQPTSPIPPLSTRPSYLSSTWSSSSLKSSPWARPAPAASPPAEPASAFAPPSTSRRLPPPPAPLPFADPDPSPSSSSGGEDHTSALVPSYPSPSTHSSAALSLLHWLLHTPFTFPWFAHSPSSSPLPPILTGRGDVRFTASWARTGDECVHSGVAVFGDSSIAWYRLSWSKRDEDAGRAHEAVKREGRYRPRCPPLDGETLYASSQMYGPLIVEWAEKALASGVPQGTGECWDLAHLALDNVWTNHEDLPKPFPSIGRTHGALLYYANAERKGGERRVLGTWTGGDTYVRAGDVVEWRKVKIPFARGGFSKLGDPDVRFSLSSPSLPSLHGTFEID